MPKWIFRVDRKDRIRYEYRKDSVEIISIVEKMREINLRSFGHVQSDDSSTVRGVMEVNVKEKIGREKSKNK